MIDRIHMSCDESGVGGSLRHFFYTIHPHENWCTIIHLGVGRIQGNNFRVVFFNSPPHAVIPESIARRVERLFSRCAKNNAAGFRWKAKFLIIVGCCYAISMQGFCPIESHAVKCHARVRQRRHIGKPQPSHIFGFLFGLHEHEHGLGQSFGRMVIKMVEVVHMGDDNRIHRDNFTNRKRQFHQWVGEVIIRRRNRRKGSLWGQERIN